jgi:transposase
LPGLAEANGIMEGINTRPLSSSEKHAHRLLAVRNVLGSWSWADRADFLGVHPVPLAKWKARYRARGEAGLDAKPVPGRARQLTPVQEEEVLSWLTRKPTEFGFLTDPRSAARVARLIQEWLGVTFHPNDLREWLASRGHSPQKPQRKARPPNPAELERWLGTSTPRRKKVRQEQAPSS